MFTRVRVSPEHELAESDKLQVLGRNVHADVPRAHEPRQFFFDAQVDFGVDRDIELVDLVLQVGNVVPDLVLVAPSKQIPRKSLAINYQLATNFPQLGKIQNSSSQINDVKFWISLKPLKMGKFLFNILTDFLYNLLSNETFLVWILSESQMSSDDSRKYVLRSA